MRFRHVASTLAADQVKQVRAINRRYAKPRLTMSPAVRWALLCLRIYLLLLVGLLVYKFVTVLTH